MATTGTGSDGECISVCREGARAWRVKDPRTEFVPCSPCACEEHRGLRIEER